MIKFFVGLERGNLLGLGFSEGNFEKLKQGYPIKFDFRDMGVELPGGVVIVYPSPEIEALEKRMPKEYSMIEVNEDAMKYMRSGRPWDGQLTPTLKVCMLWGLTEDDIRDVLSGLIGPGTEDRSPMVPAGQHRHGTRPKLPLA
jgi:hypothetical protein